MLPHRPEGLQTLFDYLWSVRGFRRIKYRLPRRTQSFRWSQSGGALRHPRFQPKESGARRARGEYLLSGKRPRLLRSMSVFRESEERKLQAFRAHARVRGKPYYRSLSGELSESLKGGGSIRLMPMEGALKPATETSAARVSGELCYQPLLSERSESLRGEAPSGLCQWRGRLSQRRKRAQRG
jgi:hypothetical protein